MKKDLSIIRGGVKKSVSSGWNITHQRYTSPPPAVVVQLPLFVGGEIFCLESPDMKQKFHQIKN